MSYVCIVLEMGFGNTLEMPSLTVESKDSTGPFFKRRVSTKNFPSLQFLLHLKHKFWSMQFSLAETDIVRKRNFCAIKRERMAQKCPSVRRHTKLQLIHHPHCSSWGVFAILGQTEFQPHSLYLFISIFFFFKWNWFLQCDYFLIWPLMMHPCRLSVTGRHLHLSKELWESTYFSSVWTCGVSGQVQRCCFIIFNLARGSFLCHTEWKHAETWVCLSAGWTAPGS